MKDQKKILLYALPAPVVQVLSEHLGSKYRIVSLPPGNIPPAETPDIALADETVSLSLAGCPVISLSLRNPLHLPTLLREIEQALREPTLYLDEFAIGGLMFHPQERRLTGKKDLEIDLTDRETDMLAYLARHRGRDVSREELLENVWQYQKGVDTHTLETHIYRLRQKINSIGDTADPISILTGKDGGYRLCLSSDTGETA